MKLDQIIEALGGASALWGPFGLLLLCGVGLPVPEDIILVASGFLGADNDLPLFRVMGVMYIGILLGDSLVYSMGRFFGRRILRTKIGSYMIGPGSLVKAEAAFKKYGRGVIFVGRFLPGLRAPIFFSAGLLRFSIFRFWLMDGLAALLSAPVFVWIGHWAWEKYAEDLSALERQIGHTKVWVTAFVVVVGLIGFFIARSKAKRDQEEAVAPEEVK